MEPHCQAWWLSPRHRSSSALPSVLSFYVWVSLLGSDHPPHLGILETGSLPASCVGSTLPPGLGSQLGMGFERAGSKVKGACRESAGVHLCWGPAITSETVRVPSLLSHELAPRGWALGFTCHPHGNQIPAWEVRKPPSRPRASPSFP